MAPVVVGRRERAGRGGSRGSPPWAGHTRMREPSPGRTTSSAPTSAEWERIRRGTSSRCPEAGLDASASANAPLALAQRVAVPVGRT